MSGSEKIEMLCKCLDILIGQQHALTERLKNINRGIQNTLDEIMKEKSALSATDSEDV